MSGDVMSAYVMSGDVMLGAVMLDDVALIALGSALGGLLGRAFVWSVWRTANAIAAEGALDVSVVRAVIGRFLVAVVVIVFLAVVSIQLLVGALIGFVVVRTSAVRRLSAPAPQPSAHPGGR